MPEVGIRVLRDNLSRYINRVREGEEVVITDHGRAVARIMPLDQPDLLAQLIEEGLVTPPKVRERTRLPERIVPSGPVSILIVEERR